MDRAWAGSLGCRNRPLRRSDDSDRSVPHRHRTNRGMREVFAEWGIPADTIDVRFINGHMYGRLRPLVGADSPVRKPPPAALLKLLVRLHPEFRRRTRRVADTLRDRPWRRTIADWATTIRPDWERRNLTLQDVDLAQLDDRALADHIDAIVTHALDGYHTHFVLHASDLGPIGLLLVFCEDHGIAADEVVPALVGASPSTSEPARLLDAMRAEVAASGRIPTSLDELRSITTAIDDYLRLRGSRIVSRYDVDGADPRRSTRAHPGVGTSRHECQRVRQRRHHRHVASQDPDRA